MNNKDLLFDYVLHLADNHLILGQRLAELCGHGPGLEQDIALTNISLDLIGQSRLLFQQATTLDNLKRNEDQLAFLRSDFAYRNVLLAEQPNYDFAFVITRQYFFDVFNYLNYSKLSQSKNEILAQIATKSLMEIKYHLRFSKNWMLRLGDGTSLSRKKIQHAVDTLWAYCGEFFSPTEGEIILAKAGIAPDITAFKTDWIEQVRSTLQEATLLIPESSWHQKGGKQGIHSEHFGHLLAEMQFMQRAYPNLSW